MYLTAFNRTLSFKPDIDWAELTRHTARQQTTTFTEPQRSPENERQHSRIETPHTSRWHDTFPRAAQCGDVWQNERIRFPASAWKLTRLWPRAVAPTHGDRKLGGPNFSLGDVWPPPAEPTGDLAISDQGREPDDTALAEPENIEMLTPSYASPFWLEFRLYFCWTNLSNEKPERSCVKNAFSDFVNK